MKKFWSFVLSLVLLLLCVPAPAYAAELAADDLVDYDELTLALNSAEYLKPHGVLSDVDFNNIEISGRIKTYDFTVGWHDTVVYGVNLTSGYIYIMDPNSGFCTCKSTGSTYTYTSTYDNATYTLKGGACRYWAG